MEDIISTIWMCSGLPHCGMNLLVRCFRDDTTWVPSKKARTPSLRASNAPVIPLVLQEIHRHDGGAGHLRQGHVRQHHPEIPSLALGGRPTTTLDTKVDLHFKTQG
ncbi:unnamed protein product [Leptidea sinapis]|uniref:Uncharacterized protein n=1 Tax=Leptidea sinapis TaxID=189913 RepID=A0A5E4PV20_9NEOP|nr:unnamed protein product [Leptidea sinapis]